MFSLETLGDIDAFISLKESVANDCANQPDANGHDDDNDDDDGVISCSPSPSVCASQRKHHLPPAPFSQVSSGPSSSLQLDYPPDDSKFDGYLSPLFKEIESTAGKVPNSYWHKLDFLTKRLRVHYPCRHAGPIQDTKDSRFQLRATIEGIICSIINSQADKSEPMWLVDRESKRNSGYNNLDGVHMAPAHEVKGGQFKMRRTGTERKNRMLTLLARIHRLLGDNLYKTKRDLFYMDENQYGNQSISDALIEDVACSLHVSRISLHVLSCSKGEVFGPLSFTTMDGCITSCETVSVMVPANVSHISTMNSKAKICLVVEKEATYQELCYRTKLDPSILGHCIMVTGKGFPDANTRQIVNLVWNILQIPIIGLFDGDPHGIDIFCNYKYGSLSMAHDSRNLATPCIQWIGILPSEMDQYTFHPSSYKLFNDTDRKKVRDLMSRTYVKQDCRLESEIELLDAMEKKLELQAFNDVSSSFLFSQYIPMKIHRGLFA